MKIVIQSVLIYLLVLISLPLIAEEKRLLVSEGTSVWDTTFGMVTLVQSGALITGTYPYSSGKIIAAISNGVICGFWWENDDKAGCGPENAWCGPFILYFSPDGKSFKGFYDKASRGITKISQLGTAWKWDGTLKSGTIELKP